MTSKDAKLLKAMDILDVKMEHFVEDNGFKVRFRFQKYTYIIQSLFDFYVGGYNLYLRGPYSPAVAEKGFEIAKDVARLRSEAESQPFKREPREILERVKDLFADEAGLNQETKLEAWTTYHYLKALCPVGDQGDKAVDELFKHKPKFLGDRERIETFLSRADREMDL